MADDSDVPPLEDMTDVLKKAEEIRETRNLVPKSNAVTKERAKVTKRPNARVVAPVDLTKGDASAVESQHEAVKPSAPKSSPASKGSDSGMFGGMKKGFLFGGPVKSTSSNANKNSSTKVIKEPTKSATDSIPYISPKTGKTESGLTFGEVQQAMSEAKGLLNNQDWITDDLLSKIEKNETLRNRFADPSFMQALEEFQKSPEEAMAKYKGNTEVEKFLQDFCGLLGDHFTNMADSSNEQKVNSNSTSKTPNYQKNQSAKITEITSEGNPNSSNKSRKSGPKILELNPDTDLPPSPHKSDNSNSDNVSSKSKSANSAKPSKIVDLSNTDGKSTSSSVPHLSTATKTANPKSSPDILTYSPGAGADMQEVSSGPAMADEEVREVLKDQRVMETLMDPEVMNIIQLLRSDPMEAQRIVDSAKGDLKEKIQLLIMKGLLRFQAS